MFWILILTCVSLNGSDNGNRQREPYVPRIVFEAEEKESEDQLHSIASILTLFTHISSLPQCAQVVDVEKRKREIRSNVVAWAPTVLSDLIVEYDEDLLANNLWARCVKDVFESYATVPAGWVLYPTKFWDWMRVKHPRLLKVNQGTHNVIYFESVLDTMIPLLLDGMSELHEPTPFCYELSERAVDGSLIATRHSRQSISISIAQYPYPLNEKDPFGKAFASSKTLSGSASPKKFSKLPHFLTVLGSVKYAPEFFDLYPHCSSELQKSAESTMYQLLGVLYEMRVAGVGRHHSLLLREGNNWFFEYQYPRREFLLETQAEVDEQLYSGSCYDSSYSVYSRMKAEDLTVWQALKCWWRK